HRLREVRARVPDGRAHRERTLCRRNDQARTVPSLPDLDERGAPMSKTRFATVWMDGCSGCHMSFLDMDERLLTLAEQIEVVYSPLVDQKEFPPDVDVTVVEGSVSSEEDL